MKMLNHKISTHIITLVAVVVLGTITSILVYAFVYRAKPVNTTKAVTTKNITEQSKPQDPIANYDQIVKPEDKSPIVVPTEKAHSGKLLHIPILMYHHVGIAPVTADATHRGLTVSPTEFETQIKWLKDNGYESVNLKSLSAEINNESVAWPKKPVIFTFDDGYTDVFENAVPVLKKYGYTGTFGIITDYPGQTQGDNYYATWAQIDNAKKDGMEIICHTKNHFDGSSGKYNADYIFKNLTGCQNDLINHLGEAPPFLIYPYGHFTPTYVSEALKAGFTMAFTVHEGSYVNTEDLMHIPRVRVNPNETMKKFIEKLEK